MTEQDQRPNTSRPGARFPFSQPSTDRREPQKNFVFIDEQNRHKRLKVVKACDGCRKRKIKCESANTNIWPCAACIRLKMTCVPPTLSGEKDESASFEAEPFDQYRFESPYAAYQQPTQHDSSYFYQQESSYGGNDLHLHPVQSRETPVHLPTSDPFDSHNLSRENSYNAPYPVISPTSPPMLEPVERDRRRQDSVTSSGWVTDASDTDLLEQMGDLQISEIGSAPYLVDTKAAEQPAMEEADVELPKSIGIGSHVQIPAEMMPSDEQAMKYFKFFFENVHPYVPVIYPPFFYRQWQDSKGSISPLILESIFACASGMLGHAEESTRWLALAKKHEESFKDTPRQSTLQGLLLLLKAREAMPTHGYYYRSWMSVVTMIAMAKDLRMHEHHEEHQSTGTCTSTSKFDCLIKSRVWHVLYIIELMIGGPQRRIDFSATTETVDIGCTYPQLDPEDPEVHISQQLSQFMRNIALVRRTIGASAKLRKTNNFDWALEPSYVELNAKYAVWPAALPLHMRIYYTADGSAPKIPFHFVANLHSYYELSIIMHHRPQLLSRALAGSSQWRGAMLTSYASAKRLCQLQEAVLESYGLNGLLCMQRGVNFAIYGILTCTMLHLVAVTHPDPELSQDAASYFTRHMRILERCAKSWPMPEMERQILSLREAFSIDITKPFELKPDFPGSPRRSDQFGSPVTTPEALEKTPPPYSSAQNDGSVPYPPHTVTSAPHLMGPSAYPTPDSIPVMVGESQQYRQSQPQMQHIGPGPLWNPSPIIHNFEAIMGMPSDINQPSLSPPQQPPQGSSFYSPPPQPMPQHDARYASYPQEQTNIPAYTHQYPTNSNIPVAPLPHYPPSADYITPSMWHEAVASAYGAGSKRRWPDSSNMQNSKRTR